MERSKRARDDIFNRRRFYGNNDDSMYKYTSINEI